MKLYERINYILLGTLWCLVIMLALDFWLNTVYHFNLFSNAHWQFIANLQATNERITIGFYIAITLAITLGILGLYILFRPKFRRIILSKNTPDIHATPIQTTTSVVPEKATTHTTEPTIITRPPHLHIQTQQYTKMPNTMIEHQKNTVSESRYTHEMRDIFEKNNYIVLPHKNIAGIPLSLIAIGTHETLWLGATNISHEQMLNAILAFKSVFTETLQDIEIDINTFIVTPTDKNDTDYILDFNSIQELSSTIDNYPNPPESEVDKESDNMNAFRGYIETVMTFLGNK